MARRSSSKSPSWRDTSVIAKRSLPRPPIKLSPLQLIEDRRLFHPEQDFRPARSFDAPRHSLKAAPPKRSLPFSNPFHSNIDPGISFVAPQKVLVCVRRSRRKEVLHALKKTGKSGQKRPRRNWLSDVSCR